MVLIYVDSLLSGSWVKLILKTFP